MNKIKTISFIITTVLLAMLLSCNNNIDKNPSKPGEIDKNAILITTPNNIRQIKKADGSTLTVSLSYPKNPSATIRYTTNGDSVSRTSKQYTGPFDISNDDGKNVIVKAKAFSTSNNNYSKEYSKKFYKVTQEFSDVEDLYKYIIDQMKEENLGPNGDYNHIGLSTSIDSLERLFCSSKTIQSFNGDISCWDVSNVENMYLMFYSSNFNRDISNWYVNNVKTMMGMFAKSQFNQDISNWDVSNVTDFTDMFNKNKNYNKPLKKWYNRLTKAQKMDRMFQESVFNQDISSWNVTSVTSMNDMFKDNTKFNIDLSSWNPSSFISTGFFSGGPNKDKETFQPKWIEIGTFKLKFKPYKRQVPKNKNFIFIGIEPITLDPGFKIRYTTDGSDVTAESDELDTSALGIMINFNDNEKIKYIRARLFNDGGGFSNEIKSKLIYKVIHEFSDKKELQNFLKEQIKPENLGPNGNYNHIGFTSKLDSLSNLFYEKELKDFNGKIDAWDVSNIIYLEQTFGHTKYFNQPLNDWDVSNVKDMSRLFFYCDNFNQPLNDWDVSNVTNLKSVFNSTKRFNQPLNNWDVSKVTDFYCMFFSAKSFNQDISEWKLENAINLNNMFFDAFSFDQDLSDMEINPKLSAHYEMFNNTKIDNIIEKQPTVFKLPKPNSSGVYIANNNNLQTITDHLLKNEKPFNKVDTSNITNVAYLFSFNYEITDQDFSSWDMSKVVNAYRMFAQSQNFNGNVSNWNLASLKDANYMFSGCKNFDGDCSTWKNISDNVGHFYVFNGTKIEENTSKWPEIWRPLKHKMLKY